MGDGSLSQEEIDALLMGADDPGASGGAGEASAKPAAPTASNKYSTVISHLTDALNTASGSMGDMVGDSAQFSKPTSSILGKSDVAAQIEAQSVVASIQIGDVTSLFVFNPQQAKKLAMNVMGATTEPTELDEAHLSSLSELSGTIASEIANHLSQKFSENLEPSVSGVKIFTQASDLPNFPSQRLLRLNFGMNIKDSSLGNFSVLIDELGPIRWSTSKDENVDDPLDGFDFSGMEGGGGDMPESSSGEGAQTMNPVSFPTFQTGGGSPEGVSPNYELLLDVQMVLTVELGRTTKYVKDVLKFGEGSIIELDKLAGEPVDLLVNGKLIAKGEVVVIDENFGVRVTDIVAPAERLAQMSAP